MAEYSLYEIPLQPGMAQSFSVSLAGVIYRMALRYRQAGGAGWTLSISDADGNSLVANHSVVTGRDLLEQLRYLGIAGGLVVQTDGDPDAVPTFDNFGSQSHLYFVTVPAA